MTGETKAAIVCGLAIFAAIVGPGAQAHADPSHDLAFLQVLDAQGISYTNASDAIGAGHQVCGMLDTGATFARVLDEVISQSHLDVYNSGFFIGASTAAFCPEHNINGIGSGVAA